MFKDLLPIGTVVTLQGGVRKIMIIGVKTTMKDNPEVIYDYIGVLYPEGFLGDEGNFMFNHSDINDIIFRGYNNPERENFLNYLDQSYTEDGQPKEEQISVDE